MGVGGWCFWLFVADWLFVTVFWVFSECSGSIFGYFLVFMGVFMGVSGVFSGVLWCFFRCFRGVFWVLGFSWCYGVYLGIFG